MANHAIPGPTSACPPPLTEGGRVGPAAQGEVPTVLWRAEASLPILQDQSFRGLCPRCCAQRSRSSPASSGTAHPHPLSPCNAAPAAPTRQTCAGFFRSAALLSGSQTPCMGSAKALSLSAQNTGCVHQPQQATPRNQAVLFSTRANLAPGQAHSPGLCTHSCSRQLWVGAGVILSGTGCRSVHLPSPASPPCDCPPNTGCETGILTPARSEGSQLSIQQALQTQVLSEAGKASPSRSLHAASRGLCFASRACRHSRNAAATKPTHSSGTKIPLCGLSCANAPSAPASTPSRQAGET